MLRWRFGDSVTPKAYIQIEPNAKQDAKLDMDVDKHLASLGVKLSKNDALQRYGRTEWKPDDASDAPLQLQQGAEAGTGQPPSGTNPTLPRIPGLANADDDKAAKVKAWKAMRRDLDDALAVCREAIAAKDKTAFINALAKLPKTADGEHLAAELKRRMDDAVREAGKENGND